MFSVASLLLVLSSPTLLVYCSNGTIPIIEARDGGKGITGKLPPSPFQDPSFLPHLILLFVLAFRFWFDVSLVV